MQFTLSIGFCPAEHYLPLAQYADDCGWDAVAVPDGLFWFEQTSEPYPYSEDGSRFWAADTPFLDPFAIVSAMAAVTRRVHFYTNVLKLAVRDPLLVAKQASSVAVIAGNRFGLGCGLSPWPEDFQVLRQDWDQRGPRSAEMIEVIRGITAGGLWEHHGRFYDYPRLQIAPVPEQPMPIYLGGLAEAVLKRAARIGDGYLGWESARCSLDDIAGMIARMQRYRQDYGTTSRAFEFKIMPASADADTVAGLRDIGVTDTIVHPWMLYPGDPMDLQHRLDCVRRYADDVITPMREGRL